MAWVEPTVKELYIENFISRPSPAHHTCTSRLQVVREFTRIYSTFLLNLLFKSIRLFHNEDDR